MRKLSGLKFKLKMESEWIMKCHVCGKKGKYGDFIIGKDGRGKCIDCDLKKKGLKI